MKKLLLVLTSFVSLVASAQTAEEIIDKFAKAHGGLDAFTKIATAKITGNLIVQGESYPLTVQLVNGKAMRSEATVMGQTIVTAYKDGKAWTINPLAGSTTPTDVEGDMLQDFRAQSNLASMLMDYKKYNMKVESLGSETVDGIATHKIKLTPADSPRSTTYYISSKDYTLVKATATREMMGQTFDTETYYSNLKDFSGLKFYMTRDMKIQGQTFQQIEFTNIELNAPVDEKIFIKP